MGFEEQLKQKISERYLLAMWCAFLGYRVGDVSIIQSSQMGSMAGVTADFTGKGINQVLDMTGFRKSVSGDANLSFPAIGEGAVIGALAFTAGSFMSRYV